MYSKVNNRYCDPDVCKTPRYVGANSWVCECFSTCDGIYDWAVTDTLEHALLVAIKAHGGQKEIDGTPYISHVIHVVDAVDTKNEKKVAALHDAVEDSDLTIEQLRRAGFDSSVVEAVRAITKRNKENYLDDYIPRVVKNKLATSVKIQDLKHNMNLNRLGRKPNRLDMKRHAKYVEAVMILRGE